MASKPIDPRPVALPNLSQLPDPTKDLFGGMTSPTALMSMNEKEVTDLFSVKPLTDMQIKPSAEAAKALQTAQQTQEAINRQAQQAQEALARREQEIAEQRQRSIDEQIKLVRKAAEERRKALEEKKEQQGGKLGAAPDGSFVLTKNINEVLSSQEWNSIVSDKQRGDQAETYLSKYAAQLKEMGATDEQVAAEIENGRGIFKAHTDVYRQGMMKDKSPIHDTIVEFAGGAGSLVTMLGGGAAKLVGADTVGDYLLDRNERIQSAVKDVVSSKVKLQAANKDYESEKYRQQYNVNPEIDIFDITGSTAAVKLAYQNGTLDSLITEQLPNILTSLGIGGAGKAAVGKFATTQVASKLPTATKILTGNLQTGSRILDKLVLPAASGSGLALGGYGTLSTISDAGSGAWQAVRGTDFKTIKEVYGESTWATAVREHGSEEAAREALADEAFNRAAKRVAPVALATSFLGLESTIAGMMTRQAVKDEAKKLTLKGVLKGVGNTALTAAEEGFEEGYTQYASNVGANPYTGIALDSGVSDAIGIGALMGGGTAAVTNALSSYAESKAQLPSETFIRDFVSQGNYNDAELKQKFERQMAWFEKQYTRDGDTSVNDVQHYKQTYYNKEVDVPYTVTREDGSTDTKTIWDLMTPEQAQSFRDYVRLNYGINTNDYARHQDTVEYDAIKNNNMEVLSRPENADLLNVWRVLNNTDTDQIPADKRDYYPAMAETTAHLRTFDNTHNTFQREAELLAFVNSKLSQLDDVQRSGVFDFGRTVLGANSRRFTDAEQQAWNELQQEQSNGTNEQNQTDNSQSGGQGPIDENAESVAEESVRTDTSQATTLHQAAEELADAFSGRPAIPDAQSVGNDNPRQGTDPSSQTNTPTTNGAGVAPPNAGVGQAQTTGDTVNPTTPEIHSGTSPQSGNTGQTNQGGQSFGQARPSSTQTTTGGRSTGASQAERNSNGRSKQTSPKTADSLAETGEDISIGVVQLFIKYNKPKNLTLKKLREHIGGKLGVSIDKDVYGQAQVLQYLAKLSNKQFIAELSVVLATRGKTVTTNTQTTINDLHSTRHELYKTWIEIQPKTDTEQSTTDTNADNGSQDVDEANFADTVDENPQGVDETDVADITEQAQEDSEQENVEQANEPVQITYEMMMSALFAPQERKERQLPTPQIAGLLEYKPTVVERQEIEDLILDDIPPDADIVDIIRRMAQASDVTYDVMLDLLISNNPTDFSEANTTYDGVVQSLKNILTNAGETQNEQPEPSSPQQTDEPSEELGKTYTIKRRPAQETDTSITETEAQPGNRTKLSATLLANNDVALNSINSYIYVKREGETGVIYKRGKRYYFSAFGGTSDIHIGDHNTDKTLGEMRIKAYSFGRFPNQVRNAIHRAGRHENTIWTETYNAVFNPNITEQEVEELLVQSVQEPILDYDQELEVAYDMLVDLLGSEANVAEYMQKFHADDLALLEQTDDVDGLVNLMLEAAVAITDTKLYDDYKSNYFLADTVAEESGVTDLLDQLIDGLQSEPVQVRTEVLADFIDWAESEKQTTPVADEMNVARPNITLETAPISPISIQKAVEGLTTKPSKRPSKKLSSKNEAKKRAERFKERHSKLIANIPIGKMSDRLSTYRSNDMAVRVEYGNTVKIGQLIAGTEYSVKFDDGTGEIIIPRPKNPQATFNTYNEDSDIKLYPAVPLYLTADFIGVTNGNQRTNTKESSTLDVKNTTTQQGTTAEVPSVSETATNRREKVVSQDKSGKWRLQVANNRLPALRADTTPRRSFGLTLSASAPSISGLKRFQDIIDDPNTSSEEKAQASTTLNNIAYNHLLDLVADIDGVKLDRNSATGLYGGAVEPSLLVNVEVDEQSEPQLRAALVKFAENFNQEQVHLRQEATGDIGMVYPDGSFNTVTYQIELNTQIDRATIDQIIADSGLFGLTVYTTEAGNSVLEFYYYGRPTDTDAFQQFNQSAQKAIRFAGRMLSGHRRTTHRAWFYAQPTIATSWGAGFTIPYTDVSSGLYTQPKNRPNAVVSAVAQSLNPTARGFDQKNITQKQFTKQRTIAKDYDKAPLYDLDNPIVRRAYEELAAEVKDQYLAMPLRGVELLTGQGEPYANSTEMREDVRINNKIKVFATTPDSFGSNPNIDYSQHPLMQDSGLTDINGQPMLMNDLFRAVHDYYAHTMSPVAFGPKGEEAAWKNHLSMMESPWAAWALTTETRGQNSWVNFRDEVQDVAIKDRPFADQKTALLPLKHAYTGQADIDTKLDGLKAELIDTYGKSSLQGSLAPKKKLTSKNSNQPDLINQQEQSNVEENDLGQSVQPTQERTTDENTSDIVGNDNTSDVGRREVPRQSAEQVGEQSQTSGTETTQDTEQLGVDTPTYYTDNLTTRERKAVKEIADNDGVDVGVVYQAITDGNIRFFSGRGDSQGASLDVMAKELVYQEVATNMSTAKDFINRLTTPPVPQETQQITQKAKTGREPIQDYLKNNPREHDTIRSYFNTQRALAGTAYDNAVAANNVTGEITSNYNLFNGSEIDFIEKMLGDRPFTDENIAQVIADTRTVYTAGITFDSLPAPVKNIIRKIWDKIKSTAAAISMALAISTGTTLAIPTEANAATLTETAVVQNIVSQNDNQGKQFIVADKQAGTLTVYTPLGQQITSTPALFGKATGDSISTNNATPSGRYDMNFTDGANIDGKGYGSSAQALSVNGRLQENNAGNVAIHRVLPIENRQGRLDTPTATDNRISHGCINVPSSFYDIHLDRKQDTVVYVMPETDAGRTGVFNVLGTSDLSRSENSVPTATQTTTDTKEQVDPAYDNANSQSVEVTPEQLTNATPHDQVKVAPKLVPTPLIIKGAEQSTQVAYTTPTVLGGANGTAPITADRIVLPKIDGKVVHTPAEQRADTSFDTEPVKDKTDDGVSLAEVAVGLAAAFGGGMYVSRRRRRAKAKKLESKKRTPVADNPPLTDSTPTPDPTLNMPQDPPTTEQVQDVVNAEHNEQVNKSANNAKSIPTDIKAPPQPTATALAVNREMWLKYLVETNQLGHTGSQEMADMLLNTLRGFEYANLAIMTDKSYEQANDGTFKNHRHWGDGEVNTDRVGVSNKLINIAAGAAPIFDNLMGKLGIARGGHEADSSLASIALAQVKSKALGAYAQIHKFFVNPMLERSKLLAQELRRGDGEIKLATGRVATANHILNEAADAMWKGFEAELAHLQDSLDKANADLAANPSNKDYPLRMMNTAKQLENEIRQVSELYTRTRNMYEGKTAWDGETKLPGGMTKARAEQDIAEVKAEYGADYAKIEENAKELTKSIRGIRQFATAAGVFTNDDIEVFNELGFDEYVPLYSEEKDPTDVNEEDNYTQSSLMDRLLQGIPLTQARSMGLTKDLSRYRRKGAKSPAADGFTNMEKFAMNMAGRIGQQNWVEMNQQLYEGTVGKPYSTANITDPVTLADLNASYDSGKVPGLIRVRPGMKDFLPADVKAKIDKVRPIMGKGRNANGDTVAFEYYWTEPAIQAEIYANTDLTDTLTVDGLRNIGTATRAAARLVTVGKPVWNLYNFVRDSFERVSVMLMRPVKDQSGNLVPKWKLATEFFRALPTIVLNSRDIYRYLVLGEVKTPLQIMLNEAVGEGAINLMTTQTEKHSVIGELKKSDLEKAGNKISKWLGDTANKTGAGGVRNALTKGFDFYIVAMTEIPQVSTALASYMAYQNVGVNKKESANRVRDAYDPNRTNNEFIHNLGQFHPFVRSAFSGHYNLARSLTQYWKPGEWQFTLAYTLGGTLGVIGLLSILAGAFDDDDDGRSALARLPLSILMGGIPVPWGENGVWTLPVGFGINKFIWGIGANFYRYLNGYQSAGETAMGLAGLLVDNTSPVQATGGSNLSENPTAAAVLTTMPMLLKPIVEMGFNTKAYGGGKVYGKDTPRDQLDSQQDNFNTPETYKKWASWLNENGFGDFRPETLRHLFESYSNLAGPLTAIPQAVIADQSEKTLGNKERKGEVFGATLTALGAGMSIQPNALDIANLTYEMDDRRYELHRKYGVGESHPNEIYEQYAQRGKRGGILKDAKYVTEVRLREKGVPEEHIKYIINGMKYQKKREELDKEFKDLALEYNRLVASGKEDLQMRQSVQNAWDALEKLTNDYVKENNNVFFTLRK